MTIDTEEEWDWNAGWPVRESGLENLQRVPEFHRLLSECGAKSTWFVNHAVASDPASREIVSELSRFEDVEIGMHIHPWNTPPHRAGCRYGERESFLETHPEEIIERKLETVWDELQALGTRPRSFRGGRYSSGDLTQRFLLQRGFTADSSVVPYTTWPDSGAPDYRERGLEPRRVGPIEAPGLWEIPLTRAFTRRPFSLWARRLERFSQTPWRYFRIAAILSRIGIAERIWLNFEDTPASEMRRLLRFIVPLKLPFLVFTVHSSSLALGCNPYSSSPNAVRRIWRDAREILLWIRTLPGFTPATIGEISDALEAQTCAQSD